jgi:UDP-N-acetyl-D-glucosamine dehydrogenase
VAARVTYSDPFVPKLRLDHHELTADDPLAMASRADCVVIVTDHAGFDYPGIVRDARLIVDTRNALKAALRRRWSGCNYESQGPES